MEIQDLVSLLGDVSTTLALLVFAFFLVKSVSPMIMRYLEVQQEANEKMSKGLLEISKNITALTNRLGMLEEIINKSYKNVKE